MYVYMSQKRRRTAMMTSFPLKLHRTHIYMKQDNIETAKRSFLTFRFSLYIYFIVAIVVAARTLFSLYVLYSLAHAHTLALSCSSIYIRRNVPRITHPRAFLRRINIPKLNVHVALDVLIITHLKLRQATNRS